jgi:hypothetical protein
MLCYVNVTQAEWGLRGDKGLATDLQEKISPQISLI